MINEIKNIAKINLDKIIQIRRDLHKNPELSFKEYNTSKKIQEFLKTHKIPYTYGIVKTGIIAKIEGKNPNLKEIVLRADMDALPIEEENDIEYCSINKGVMHACGHDVHSASLLGSALILNKLKEKFSGTVKFIFQPGEEKLPGGAKLMLEEGVFESIPNSCIAQHVFPDLPAGKVGFKSGIYMASADELHVKIIGKGGHAALPHKLNDPILMAAQIINSLQQIVSRNNKPNNPSVLSFGYINGNGATNVIPNYVELKGTFRTFDEKWRSEAHSKMKKISNAICESSGGKCEFDIKIGYPFLVNDIEVTKNARSAAVDYLGENNVVDLDLRMTSEDFAYFSQKAPSCFYRLGTSNKNNKWNLHTPSFNIDEKALSISSGLMAYIAVKQLLK
jgi:amidohydrolase